MPSVARVFSLALASQAFGAFAVDPNLMRNEKMRSVEADGDIKPMKFRRAKADYAASLMAMSVSASAQTDEIDKPEMSIDEVFENKVQGMLHDVEDMAQFGVTPAPDKIPIIKSIVADELVPDLKATHDAAAKQVGINLAAIDTCNSNAVTHLQHIAATTEGSVGQERTEHATCREAEKGKNSTKTSQCAELDAFLGAIMVPAKVPEGRPREEMVQYTETMSEYFCPKGPICETLDEECKRAEQEHAKHKSTCDRLQAAFEMGFCTWRTELNDVCVALAACYTSAVKVYDGHMSDTKELIKKWKVEYAALKKILCYVEVWLSDNDVKTADAKQFDKCNGATVDTSPMDIDFGTPADPAQCSLAAVENHPGTQGFVTTEYANFNAYVVGVIPCLPIGGPTAEPTKEPVGVTEQPATGSTAAPTTEPTEKPTTGSTAAPTTEPTEKPTTGSTAAPTTEPTEEPTTGSTAAPTTEPTEEPTTGLTAAPTTEPTEKPTTGSTAAPTTEPTEKPTTGSTAAPTTEPTEKPTAGSTAAPTTEPTEEPTTGSTAAPTTEPTEKPTTGSTAAPTEAGFCQMRNYAFSGSDKGSWASVAEAEAGCMADPKCEGFYSNGEVYYKSGAAYDKKFGRWPDSQGWTAWIKPGYTPTGNAGPTALDANAHKCDSETGFCHMQKYAFAGGDKGSWESVSEAEVGCTADPKCEGFYSNGGVYYKSGAAYDKKFGRWPDNQGWTAWIKPGYTPTGNAGPTALDANAHKCDSQKATTSTTTEAKSTKSVTFLPHGRRGPGASGGQAVEATWGRVVAN